MYTQDIIDFQERIQQFWDSPGESFQPAPWMPDLPDGLFNPPQSNLLQNNAPIFALAPDGWFLYVQIIIILAYMIMMLIYPIAKIIEGIALKRVFGAIVSVGSLVMGVGWFLSLGPAPEYSILVSVGGVLLSSACVLYELIRRGITATEQDDELAKTNVSIMVTTKPILAIGVSILIWHMLLWLWGQ